MHSNSEIGFYMHNLKQIYSCLPKELHFSRYKTEISKLYLPLCSRTQAEMGHTCRGTINLATANIAVEDSCNFVISNGGAQTYHLKANSEVERQRWITALELAKAKAVRMQAESGEREHRYVKECRRQNIYRNDKMA